MVAVAQLVERRIVVPDVAGSIPVGHPISFLLNLPITSSGFENAPQRAFLHACVAIFSPSSFLSKFKRNESRGGLRYKM
jgi:hypothetical protein